MLQNTSNFINAVIDKASFKNILFPYIEFAKNSNEAEIVFGGTYDDSVGYFIRPTLIKTIKSKIQDNG